MAKKTKITSDSSGKAVQSDAPPDPSVKSNAYQFMEPKWSMIMTLMGGTDMMRIAGQQYLPQHPEESQGNYNERLNRSTLFNMFELTLDSLVGKPFVEPIKLNNDVPAPLVELAKDVDLQGNDITSFSREWLRDSVAKGFSSILVDMPVLRSGDKPQRTLEDDIQEKRRPYWSLVRPEQVIFAYAEMVNGVEKLKHIRIRETETRLQGFNEVQVEHVRVLEPGLWQLWELQQQDDKKDPVWVMVDSGTSDLDEIPLITFYANRTGFMLSKPPLEDLAHLNIRHWQSTSDQINILTVARFPMLACSGASLEQGQEDNIAIGPRQLLSTRDPQGRFYYVEHSGKAIDAGRVDLQDIESAMAAYGAEFLRRRIGGRTATERALDSSEAISPLRDIVNRFTVSVNRAMTLTAKWMGADAGGTVTINTDFTEDDMNSAALTTLRDARMRGDISRRTWLTEMKRWEVLAADLDVDAEMKQIELEAQTLIVKPTFTTATEAYRTNIDDTGGGPNATDLVNATSGPDNTQIPATKTEPGNPATKGLPDKTKDGDQK